MWTSVQSDVRRDAGTRRLDADFRFDDGFRVVQFTPDWYAAYMVAEQAGTELPQ